MSSPDSPRQRVAAACEARGRDAFVDDCMTLLSGERVDVSVVHVLGGRGAAWVLAADEEQQYWLRVWAARGLLWAWEARAVAAVRGALGDEAWRVREMACKVVARHLVDELLEDVAPLRLDRVARVRAAAERAVVHLTAAGR